MATAMTIYDREEWAGHYVCTIVSYTSGGTANTLTIPAGNPYIDLTHAHPLVAAYSFLNEAAADQSNSSHQDLANEMKRGTAADSAAEMSIMTNATVSLYTTDKDGIAFLFYKAADSRRY